MLPSLPLDAWNHVAQYLTPNDLKSLSETSKTLFKVVTSEHQFRLRVDVHDSEVRCQRWSLMYRRFRALRWAPDVMTRVGRADSTNGYTTIVCSVNDTIVFFDGTRKRLVGFPAAWVYPVDDSRDAHCVVTGHDTICIVQVNSEEVVTLIKCISIRDGSEKSLVRLSRSVLANAEFSRGRTRRTVIALSAGRNGGHLAFLRNGTVTIARLSDGLVVREWTISRDTGTENGPDGDFGWLVRGEDCGWCGGEADGGERVVGILRLKTKDDKGRHVHEVLDIIQGNVIRVFSTETQERLIDTVISRDQRWMGRRVVKEHRQAVIWGSGFRDGRPPYDERNNVGMAGGSFGISSCEFALGRGGREMRFTPIGLRDVAGVESDGWIRRVWYNVTTQVDTLKGIRRVRGRPFDWAVVSGDGRVLLASCRSVGVVSIFDLEQGNCVRSLHCGVSIDEICLVGQHWLVTIDTSGFVRSWHFGKWCQRNPGAHASQRSCSHDGDGQYSEYNKCQNLFRLWDSVFPPSF